MGDPYYPRDGNGGYDVKHYLLEVIYEPSTDLLTGVATIRSRATQNLSSFNLDLDGLRVQSIEVDGHPASWRRKRGELTVTPDRGLRNDRQFTTFVHYRGVPRTINDEFGVSGFMHTDDGALVVGEPHVAATWYPVNDHPIDKAAYTFRIGVPNGLEAVANGILKSRRTEDGRTTWTWEANEPMASYLTTATVGEFDLRDYREDGIRFWDALDPDLFVPVEPRTGNQHASSQAAAPPTLGEIAEDSLARQGEIIDFLSDTFIDYPFSAAGGIVDDHEFFFALENQTRPIYDKGFFTSPESGANVIVHEIAHQWYGDSVAIASWKHIWLNEGFATYAEWLWSEREGLGTAQELFDLFYSIPRRDPFWDLKIGNPGRPHLFDFPVYARGAMTLHQLRLKVGDSDFFRILRSWARIHSDDNVTTSQLIRLSERISGRGLDALFTKWLFSPRKPDLPGGAVSRASFTDLKHAPPAARSLVERLGETPRFTFP
ncbi:MAG: M1 family metallopeptidase [Actinomycetota bacterium]